MPGALSQYAAAALCRRALFLLVVLSDTPHAFALLHPLPSLQDQLPPRIPSASETALVQAVLEPAAGGSAAGGGAAGGAKYGGAKYGGGGSAKYGGGGGGGGGGPRDELAISELLMKLSWTSPPELADKPGGDAPIVERLRETVCALCHNAVQASSGSAAASDSSSGAPALTVAQLLPLARALQVEERLLEVTERVAELVDGAAGGDALMEEED